MISYKNKTVQKILVLLSVVVFIVSIYIIVTVPRKYEHKNRPNKPTVTSKTIDPGKWEVQKSCNNQYKTPQCTFNRKWDDEDYLITLSDKSIIDVDKNTYNNINIGDVYVK